MGPRNPPLTRTAALRGLAGRYATAIRFHDPHRDARGLDLVEAVVAFLDDVARRVPSVPEDARTRGGQKARPSKRRTRRAAS